MLTFTWTFVQREGLPPRAWSTRRTWSCTPWPPSSPDLPSSVLRSGWRAGSWWPLRLRNQQHVSVRKTGQTEMYYSTYYLVINNFLNIYRLFLEIVSVWFNMYYVWHVNLYLDFTHTSWTNSPLPSTPAISLTVSHMCNVGSVRPFPSLLCGHNPTLTLTTRASVCQLQWKEEWLL